MDEFGSFQLNVNLYCLHVSELVCCKRIFPIISLHGCLLSAVDIGQVVGIQPVSELASCLVGLGSKKKAKEGGSNRRRRGRAGVPSLMGKRWIF